MLALLLFVWSTVADGYEVGTFVSDLLDASRTRTIAYTLYYPRDFVGSSNVLLFSHGGRSSFLGHTGFSYFGIGWAEAGYVAVHLNHSQSEPDDSPQADWPQDVSFVIDQLQAGKLPFPAEFTGSLELSAFGHVGRSSGAYTSIALAGGSYQGFESFRDSRIAAIAAVSPQGAGLYGGFDDGTDDNTWVAVDVPVLIIVGSEEKDSNAAGTIVEEDWRLTPFLRFPDFDDKFQVLLPGLGHSELGNLASPEASDYMVGNTRLFFDVYLRRETAGVCLIGTSPEFNGQELSAKSDPKLGLATTCPPPIGVPEPASEVGMLVSLIVVALLRIGSSRGRPTEPLSSGARRTCGTRLHPSS